MAPPDFGRSVNPISTRWGRLCPPNNTGTPGFSDLPTAEYVWCMVLHGRYAICVCICRVPICPFFLIPYVETSNVVSTYKTMDSLGAIPEDRNVLCCTQVHFSKISSFCNFYDLYNQIRIHTERSSYNFSPNMYNGNACLNLHEQM